ncbi:MAG: B12-binding domain-containing radical SAM protein [Aureispira sp.]
MAHQLLLLTPPFTQLNTPYPATAYLKGFLNTQGIAAQQADLGIEVILALFNEAGLIAIFEEVEAFAEQDALSENGARILELQDSYISTIDPVVAFLQHQNPTLAHQICSRYYLPEASRFDNLQDLDWAFGTMGSQDRARHLATLYLEDLGDLIQEAIDPHFGFSRYAERLGRAASHFDELEGALEEEDSLVSTVLVQLVEQLMEEVQPTAVCLSVPFPGNLFGALKCGQFIKNNYPEVAVIMGGGYPNTELRRLSEERLFDYVDYVCLDDGELPLLLLLEYLEGKRTAQQLKRVFLRQGGVVLYSNLAVEKDIPQREVGTPDYSDLLLKEYLSVIEIVNPMHRLWSDGRWNKLTLAHGCYWGKCSFCDVSLDYIQRYEPVTASLLCDRIETIIEQTGQNGFHFVDEAAPPALMRDLAIEIIKRNLTVVWWTNIRFEKSFTPDLCRLLKASGCIAVSGGLEVASDRLLALMKKGVTVAQVARVAAAFTAADIMVHAYLMYGFPTETAQETIDALEMVRQLLEAGVVQSGFWHQFAMTAHSPVGLAPEEYQVQAVGPDFGGFAENDLFHEDPTGAEHEQFSDGLKQALFNYMHGAGLDWSLQEWFDHPVPRTSVAPNFIANALADASTSWRKNARVLWLNAPPECYEIEEGAFLQAQGKQRRWRLEMPLRLAEVLQEHLTKAQPQQGQIYTVADWNRDLQASGVGDLDELKKSYLWEHLIGGGLLIV